MATSVSVQLAAPAKAQGAERTAQRFLYLYFILYNFPTPVHLFSSAASRTLTGLWHTPVVWVGKQLFGLNITTFGMGGDGAFGYIRALCCLVLATLATAIWTACFRRRNYDAVLAHWGQVYIRYALAVAMVSYGMSKVFQDQFSFPSLFRMNQSIGDLSPQILLWTFMGFSRAYALLGGVLEVIGAMLLFFRRTTPAGALLLIGVLMNVVALNLCYDVPVKLHSIHLLAMAIFLAAPAVRPLVDLLLLNRAATPRSRETIHFPRKWLSITVRLLKATVILVALITYTGRSRNSEQETYLNLKQPPLYGVYLVEEFVHDGQTLPLTIDTVRWKTVIFEAYDAKSVLAGVILMNNSTEFYKTEYDESRHTISLQAARGPAKRDVLTYSSPEAGTVLLTGDLRGAVTRIVLKKREAFPLQHAGFRWLRTRN